MCTYIICQINRLQLGPAFVHLRLHSPTFGEFQIFQTITPVEPLLQKVVHRFYASPFLGPIMKILIYGESVMVCCVFFSMLSKIELTNFI